MNKVLEGKLDKFCNLLDEQAELQETLVAVCLAQLKAGIEADISKLNEKTSAITFLAREISKLDEKVRNEVPIIVSAFCNKRSVKKLSEVVSMLPLPWEARAKESLERIKVSLLYLKEWSKEALPFYKSALKSRQELLKVISPESMQVAPGYSEAGAIVEVNSQAKFVDDRG